MFNITNGIWQLKNMAVVLSLQTILQKLRTTLHVEQEEHMRDPEKQQLLEEGCCCVTLKTTQKMQTSYQQF